MEKEWAEKAKGLLRAEMARRQVSYKGLAELLSGPDAPENEANLRNKVSRAGFSAAFFLRAMTVIGCKTIRLTDD